MRLLTHNFLQSNVRGTERGYPLAIEASELAYEESTVNLEMVLSLLPKLDYAALVQASRQVQAQAERVHEEKQRQQPTEKDGMTEGGGQHERDGDSSGAASALAAAAVAALDPLPDHLPADMSDLDGGAVASLYRFLFDVHVLEGHLVCPDTDRKFPVSQGIPNMVLHEDELGTG